MPSESMYSNRVHKGYPVQDLRVLKGKTTSILAKQQLAEFSEGRASTTTRVFWLATGGYSVTQRYQGVIEYLETIRLAVVPQAPSDLRREHLLRLLTHDNPPQDTSALTLVADVILTDSFFRLR